MCRLRRYKKQKRNGWGTAEDYAFNLSDFALFYRAASVLELLEEMGKVPKELENRIMEQHNPETLSKWLKLAARAETIEEFEKGITADNSPEFGET